MNLGLPMTANLHSHGLMAFDLLPLEECFVLTLSTLGKKQKDSGIYKLKLTIPEYVKTILYFQRLKKPTNSVICFVNYCCITAFLPFFANFL